MPEYHIFVVSDGTGETATKMSKAALLQFQAAISFLTRHSNIQSQDAIREVVREAEKQRALIIHTFASQDLRRAMERACQDYNVPSHDLLGLLMDELAEFFGLLPSEKPGLMHQVDDGYFERLEALAYAVRNDDSRRPAELLHADIILLGLSRTSKTPLSIYLAQEGWRVANIPLSIGDDPSKELAEVDQKKVVGLIASAEQLAVVRKARLSRLGTKDSSYADAKQIDAELGYCRTLYAQHPAWLIVDVTGKSVEEIASEILDKLFGKERRV